MRYSAEGSAVWRHAAQDCDTAGWNRQARAAQQIFADEIGEGRIAPDKKPRTYLPLKLMSLSLRGRKRRK
jgi:hypothetical protein